MEEIILLLRENKFSLSRDLEKMISLSRENGGNYLVITGKRRKLSRYLWNTEEIISLSQENGGNKMYECMAV